MSQEFVILISAAPVKAQVHLTAIRFIEQLVKQQVAIRSIFFYQDAVQVANRFCCPPSDEPQLVEKWHSISHNNQLELQTCVAASYRRGIIDTHQAEELSLEIDNLHPSFKMTGLGQLAAAMSDSKVKLIHFK